MKINSPDHNNHVSVGPSILKGINVTGKKNQGFGQQLADLTVTAVPILIVVDDEMIDAAAIKVNHPISTSSIAP
jgi:hypothetical protein